MKTKKNTPKVGRLLKSKIKEKFSPATLTSQTANPFYKRGSRSISVLFISGVVCMHTLKVFSSSFLGGAAT